MKVPPTGKSPKRRTHKMTLEKLYRTEQMICKECQRNSLAELCENWGIETEDFYEFIELARKQFIENNQKK